MASASRLRAVFVDFDGTIADSLGMMRSVYRSFVEEVGGVPTDAEFDSLNGPPLVTVVERLCATHSVLDEPQVALARYQAMIDEHSARVPAMPGAELFLREAAETGIVCGMVTSNGRARVQRWLELSELASVCSVLVAGEDVVHGKPHPEPYLLALSKTGLGATEALAIEDSPSGVKSAVEAGIRTVWLNATSVPPDGPAHAGDFAEASRLVRELVAGAA